MILFDFDANLVIFSHLGDFFGKKSKKTLQVIPNGIIG
jgi:hypothetical protein